MLIRLRQLEAAGRGLECRADESADLSRRFIRLVLHRAHEPLHAGRIGLDLPGDIGLDDDPQAITGAGVLQAAGGGAQSQIDWNRRLERCRQPPGQARRQQHAGRIAEAGDHGRLAGAHLHQARGGDGEGDQHSGDQQRRRGSPAMSGR